MNIKRRFDYVMLKAHKDEHGFLVDTPVVARVGLQVYTLPDGSQQREFRPRSEVFDHESLDSFRGKAITLGHVLVTPENAKEVTVGNCSGSAWAEVDEGKVRCPITIMDQAAIDAAESKEAAELSVGYDVIEIHEPGWGSNQSGEFVFNKDLTSDFVVPSDWVEFDVLQTRIRVNHLAMVNKGRAGIAKLNLDGSEEVKYDVLVNSKNKEVNVMKFTIKVDSVDVEVSQEVKQAFDKMGVDLQASVARGDSLEAERDGLQAKVDGIPTLISEEVAKVKADAEVMSKLVIEATELGVKCDNLDVKGVKVAIVKAMTGRDVSDKSDSYIDAAIDFAKDGDIEAANRAKVNGPGSGKKNDAADNEIPDPQARFR
ncbi:MULTISPECIES: DUF2213 domain-containing protein [Gammaproteobacteria]|uniref:DUF2213 domain-containing protein n=1 Tax=Gammaproteobacteria TaxID=1236 RepID=UPI002FC9ED99